jgi:ubiquinone/menaquinone biosynthesis C-methylase UbiE
MLLAENPGQLPPPEIKRQVLAMYLAHPYPQWTKEERRDRFAAALAQFRFLGLAEAMSGARFLDVGCGTGNRTMKLAKHFGVAEYVGVDQSSASLAIARRVAAEEEFDRFVGVEADVFQLPFPDASFDVVLSQGVLHHTSDPLRGYKELVRVCRPGGLISIFLYNKWNHWRHNLQKNKVSRLAGEDFEKRFEIAHRLYGRKPSGDMTAEEVATFYDQYCHPHKSDHTIGETLEWFDDLGLQYWGSYPPVRFKDFVAAAQHRGRLLAEYPRLYSRLGQLLVNAALKLPTVGIARPPFKRPTRLHQLVFQLGYAIQGAGGEYSGGCGLTVRKPIR